MESPELEDVERGLFRPGESWASGLTDRWLFDLALLASAWASCSSATPFLRSKSLLVSLASLGARLGLRSCCVRDGRET